MKDSQNDNFGSSKIPQEKKNWVSPEITNWENKNIENTGGIGPDGGGLGYL